MTSTLLDRPDIRSAMDIRPMTGTCGVEVLGVDVVAEVRRLLAERGVVFFRDQPLTPDTHRACAKTVSAMRSPRYNRWCAGATSLDDRP